MRRTHLATLILLLTTAAAVALAAAQETSPHTAEGQTIPIPPGDFDQMIDGAWVPVELEPIDPAALIPDDANPGAELCEQATILFPPDGSQTTVNGVLEQAEDPVLSCTWGIPSGPRGYQGYRTIWYQFTAPITGRVIVNVTPNANYLDNYDTIVAVHSGMCGSFTTIACNDDHEGFLSQVTAVVQSGQTYYVEVADRSIGVNGDAIANISIFIDPSEVETYWRDVTLMPEPRSRHAAVPVGESIYVIAGQIEVQGNPLRTGRVDRYNTLTGEWVQLATMAGPDGFGYSNTTAVHKNGRIYLPSGYVGDDQIYAGKHWVYDIAANGWLLNTPVPWPNGEAAAYSAAVAHPTQSGYYLTGGITGPPLITTTSTVLNNLWYFIPDPQGNGDWLPFPNSGMSVGRYSHAAAWVGGKLCVAGGLADGGASHVLLSGGECYDALSSTWTPIDDLNEPRFNAGSAVSPDGRWFVFGGTTADANGNLVAAVTTEVYDPAIGIWETLDFRYNLWQPGRSWPRGGFVGDTLWVFGGETVPGEAVIPLVERLTLPHDDFRTLLPAFFHLSPLPGPGATLADANHLALNVPENHRFVEPEDHFDTFYFDIDVQRTVRVKLRSIPDTANYDLEIYNGNKMFLARGNNIGSLDEEVTLTLAPGRYYVLVIRAFPVNAPPPDDDYRIVVEG